MNESKYIKIFKNSPLATKRIFCIPFAGGSASFYREWAEQFYPNTEICAIQLSGREDRLVDDLVVELDKAAEEIYQELLNYQDKPFILFGHSLGALICYETVLKLQRRNRREPDALIVSGCGAPHVPPKEFIYHLPKQQFKTELKKLGGTPEMILEEDEIFDLFYPMLKGDFEMVETYTCKECHPVHTKIFAFGGTEDKEVLLDELLEWEKYTDNDFHYKMFKGEHFFVKEQSDDVIQEIKNIQIQVR